MKNPTFTLRMMFVFVTIAALTCAIIVTHSEVLMQVFGTCVFLFVMAGPVGAICCRGKRKAFWLGVTFSGIGYFLLWEQNKTHGLFINNIEFWLILDPAMPMSQRDFLDKFGDLWWTMIFAVGGGYIGSLMVPRGERTEVSLDK